MSQKIDPKCGIIALFILFAALSRILPHPPNFTPIGGMALFGAAYFTKKYWAFIIPLVALFISDLVINNLVYPTIYPEYYNGFTLMTGGWYFIYGAFAVIAAMGILAMKKRSVPRIIGASVIASLLFFVVTNFGAWIGSGMYPKSMAGLVMAYEAGLPFLRNTLVGDLFYVGVMFGSFEFLKAQFPELATVRE